MEEKIQFVRDPACRISVNRQMDENSSNSHMPKKLTALNAMAAMQAFWRDAGVFILVWTCLRPEAQSHIQHPLQQRGCPRALDCSCHSCHEVWSRRHWSHLQHREQCPLKLWVTHWSKKRPQKVQCPNCMWLGMHGASSCGTHLFMTRSQKTHPSVHGTSCY